MNAEAKTQVPSGIRSIDHKIIGALECGFISVARDIPHKQLITGFNGFAAQFDIVIGGSTHIGQRRLPANHKPDSNGVLQLLIRVLIVSMPQSTL
jgi:hypothetical protein